MTTVVAALFNDVGTAHRAVYNLIQCGVSREDVQIMTRSQEDVPPEEEEEQSAWAISMSTEQRAGTLVIAEIKHMEAEEALALLNRYRPIGTGHEEISPEEGNG